MFSSKHAKVFLLGLVVSRAIHFCTAKEEAKMTALRGGGGRVLYYDGMGGGDHMNQDWSSQNQENHDMMGSDHNGMMGDNEYQHQNGMMDSDEYNMTSWHNNSEWMHDGNHHSGEFVVPSSRQCNTQHSSGQVQCACRSNMTDMMSDFEDELEFKIRATRGDYLSILVEYQPVGEGTQNDTETKFQLVYDRLLEYRKVGNVVDNHYEWGVDEVVAETPLNDWDELSAVPATNDLIIYSAKSPMVTFTFTIAQADLNDLSTNKMKIDFLLENYTWNASGDTYVALVSRIETRCAMETHMVNGTDQVSDVLINFKDVVDAIGVIPFGEYTWATTAEASTGGNFMDILNGTDIMVERGATVSENEISTIPVIASMSPITDNSNSTSEEIAFSFVGEGKGANRIFWDPEAGIGYTSTRSLPSSSSTSILASSLLATVVSFGIVWCT